MDRVGNEEVLGRAVRHRLLSPSFVLPLMPHVYFQLVQDAGVRAVVSLNEDYELRYLANSEQVGNPLSLS